MKIWLAFLFILEAACLGAIILQILQGQTGFVRSVSSLLLLAAFAKTEYDWLRLDGKQGRME